MKDWRERESEVVKALAKQLEGEGYRVVINPKRTELPFDLGTYRPDIIAQIGDGGLVVEVRPSEHKQSVDRFVEIAEVIREHRGWRFVFIPADQADKLPASAFLPDWQQVYEQFELAQNLLDHKQLPISFITFWIGLETMLRLASIDNHVPVNAMSPAAMIKHLYTFGILSVHEFNELEQCFRVRNAVVHGLRTDGLDDLTPQLARLCSNLFARWSPGSPEHPSARSIRRR